MKRLPPSAPPAPCPTHRRPCSTLAGIPALNSLLRRIRGSFRAGSALLSLLLLGLLASLGTACQPICPGPTPAARSGGASPLRPTVDEHSFAQPGRVVTRHLELTLDLNFDQRTIRGQATLDLKWIDSSSTDLRLDTRDLTIIAAETSGNGRSWKPVPFELGARDPLLGQCLTVHLGAPARRVRIHYLTSPKASGLQWLTPAMTLGKRAPLLFSQSQPVHARSWVPLQDTPAVRFTYEARVSCPPEIRVLMSADHDPHAPRTGRYRFRMPQPIPSYLLAIAAGDLVFRPLTPRTGIWAEPDMVARAAHEFEDTGRMMEAAERLYGAYRWDRYDLLVLPPSFPYGGMENPRLTFVSPTVITGDRSLVSLVAHELAHSWSGNLVTSASHRDLWLNEGFTTYVESRIVEELYGRERADMENVTSRQELSAEYTEANRPLQVLALAPGVMRDPEGYLTGTIYTKGAWFLHFLEQRFGRATFDRFLRSYFEHFAFRSISTEDFVDFARRHLLDAHPGTVRPEEFNAWLHEPGIPPFAPQLASPRLAAVDAARRDFLSSGQPPSADLVRSWLTQEWLHFLAGMPATLPTEHLRALDAAHRFTGTPNVEIANVWYPLTLRSGYREARPAIESYLKQVGRRRMVLPTYRALAATPEDRAWGRAVLDAARDGLHPITLRAAEAALAESSPSSTP